MAHSVTGARLTLVMLTDSLLRTKLIRPPLRPQLVPRPHLLAAMQQALTVPLTLVSAPAGFGKTTTTAAAVQALAATGTAVAWLSLDERDNEPLRFWRYVLSAVETAVSLPTPLANSLTLPQPPPIPALLTSLLNQLTGHTTPLLLVIDDLHLIDQPEIHDGLAQLLDHTPANLHLLLITRADPPLPLHRLRARGHLLEIRVDRLRFSDTEAAAFLREVMSLALAPADLTLLHAQTEGWPTGLQLAALALMAHPDDPHAFIQRLAESGRYILDYLTEEVLAQQPEAVRAFLLQTAVLERLCGPLCDAVLQTSGSQAMLADLARRNLFILPAAAPPTTETAVPWYRYHHLFAALLLGHLRQQQPAHISGLHQRAAAWYAAQGEIETAVTHALLGEAYPLAAHLLEENASAILMQGRARTLERWLQQIPADLLPTMPRTNLAFAQALLLRGQFQDIEPYLQQAEASELAADDHALQAGIQTLRATLADSLGQSGSALQLARQALANLPPNDAMLQTLAHFSLAGALRVAGDVPESMAAYNRTISLSQTARLPLLEMLSRAHLGFFHILCGQLHQAERIAAPVLAAGSSHPALAAILGTMAQVHLERNQLAEAETCLQRGLALGREGGHNAAVVQCRILQARLLVARGETAAAYEALLAADQLVAQGVPDWLEPLLRSQQVTYWLAQGDELAAVQALRQTLGRCPPYLRDVRRLAQARVYYHQGQPVLPLLDEVVAAAVSQARLGLALEARLLRALAHHTRGDSRAAQADVLAALQVAEPEGYVRPFVECGAGMAMLLTAVAHPYAAVLLSAFPPEMAPSDQAALPEPLTDREIDVLRLMARGLTYQQIADELIVSVNTVRHHVKGLYSKLSVSSRALAVAQAQELGLL